jgi:NAD(P)-dependent dehydrogenase (short-subunit alcohol dehydrogenase family)
VTRPGGAAGAPGIPARLEGVRVLVTGAASGIGEATARRLAAEGARVAVADLDLDAARAVADGLATPGVAVRVDVADAGAVREALEAAERAFGGLDALVNNAGVGVAATTPDTSEEDWDRVVGVCLKGTFLVMRHGIPVLRRSTRAAGRTASVTNVCSIAALVGIPERAAYSAAKGGVLALTRAAAIDHVQEGVRVNCVVPGTVDTPWVRRITAGHPDPEAAREAMRARQPHGRLVAAGEVAAMIAYLASDEAASVIGAAMVVDGGMTAR